MSCLTVNEMPERRGEEARSEEEEDGVRSEEEEEEEGGKNGLDSQNRSLNLTAAASGHSS